LCRSPVMTNTFAQPLHSAIAIALVKKPVHDSSVDRVQLPPLNRCAGS
jgi:hypothetical protein